MISITKPSKSIPEISQNKNDYQPLTTSPIVKEILYVSSPNGLNLRSFSSTNSKIIEKLATGAKLTVLNKSTVNISQRISWYQVKTLKGNIGWVYSGANNLYLSDAPPTKKVEKEYNKKNKFVFPKITIKKEIVIYLGPQEKKLVFERAETSSPMVGSVIINDKIEIIDKSNDGLWAKIILPNNKTGWLKMVYYKDYRNPRVPINIKKLE